MNLKAPYKKNLEPCTFNMLQAIDPRDYLSNQFINYKLTEVVLHK